MSGQKKSENFQILDKLTDIFDGGPRNLLNYLHPGQIVLLVIFAISLLGSLLIGMFTLRKFIKDRNVQAPSRLTELCWNTTQLGLIFTFIVLCDTGKIGWITQNAYSWPRFVTLIGVFLLLGLLTVRKNTKPDLLDVNITTEIKGWMQVSILVYHYINAYNVLPIFIVIRLFVTMYVTLSAYGHFCFFWKKNYLQGDEMLKHSICKRAWICLKQIIYRYIQVLFRMNFLVILLCVVFRKTYMKYYFVPLITTAYTLSAATMTVWVLLLFFLESSCSQHLKTMNVSASNSSVRGQVKAVRNFVELNRKDICFLVVLSAATLYSHLLHKSAYLFSLTFFKSPLAYLFGPENGQWMYRWSIDCYSTVLGLSFGYAVSKWKEFRQRNENDKIALEKDIAMSKNYYKVPTLILKCLVIGGSSLGLLTFVVLATRHTRSHRKYTDLHPYLMSAPIIAILVLRNSSNIFRSYYSKFFVWVGQIALELFVLQYHMWITGPGGGGVITFIPTYTYVNFVLTTALFFLCCHRIHKITQYLTSFFMP